MNIFEFMSDSPWLSFFLAWFLVQALHYTYIYCINRPLRHANIRKHGWPPEHCDADGDFVATDKDED